MLRHSQSISTRIVAIVITAGTQDASAALLTFFSIEVPALPLSAFIERLIATALHFVMLLATGATLHDDIT
jgi:hypothetical protein